MLRMLQNLFIAGWLACAPVWPVAAGTSFPPAQQYVRALNPNPDFILDQTYESGTASLFTNNPVLTNTSATTPALSANSGIGTNRVADFWWLNFHGTSCGSVIGAGQQLLWVGPYYYSNNGTLEYQLNISVVIPCSGLAANTSVILESDIEGPDIADLQWGTPNAQPAFLQVGLQSPIAGELDFSLSDGDANSIGNNIILPITVSSANATANAMVQYNIQIPPPVVNQFSPMVADNYAGIRIRLALGCGTNFQRVPLTWLTQSPSSPPLCTATALQFANQLANTELKLAYIRLIPGVIGQSVYLRTPIAELYQTAQRFFAKTFHYGTPVGQNKGANGALTISAPYASSTKNTVTMNWRLPVPMFAQNTSGTPVPPAFIAYSPGAATANCRNLTTNADLGTATFSDISSQGATITCPVGSGSWSIGDLIGVQATADIGPW